MCLLDPNTLSDDGTVALKDATFSDDGKLMAYSLSSGGSDWATIKVCALVLFCCFYTNILALWVCCWRSDRPDSASCRNQQALVILWFPQVDAEQSH